jgi:hypothetical protein
MNNTLNLKKNLKIKIMNKILLIICGLLLIAGCVVKSDNDERTSLKVSKQISTSDGNKIEEIIDYKESPRGISLITLKTGERFIYCETPNGIGIQQIKSDGTSIDITPLDTTTLY